jgi:hypothetical protein
MAMAATIEMRRSRATDPDRLTVMLLTLAAFLVVLALLASQFKVTAAGRAGPLILHRRVYETRVVETIVGPSGGGSAVTQSVSSSGSTATVAPPPITRVS